MTLTFRDLLTDPDHFLFAFSGNEAHFVPMDREAYRRSIFLDRRIQPAGPGLLKAPLAPLAAAIPDGATPRIGWIFHIAHCGSTLLARALDRNWNLVLREPAVLRQLGVSRGSAGWAERLKLARFMLARRYAPDAPVLVKANVPVNVMLDALLAPAPEEPALFLYLSFEEYLLAVLRTPNHRRWVQSVVGELSPQITAEAGDLRGLDSACTAAALWLAQMRLFKKAMDSHPVCASLDADMLFSAPDESLIAAQRFLGGSEPPEQIGTIVAGPLFSTYSKDPRVTFDRSARRTRRDALNVALKDEIRSARRWLDERIREYPIPQQFSAALVGEGRLLS